MLCGASPPVGGRWFREGGGMPPISLAPRSARFLSFAEREEYREAQHRSRTLRNLRNRAQRLGLGLIDLETGELMDPGVS